MVEAHMIQVGAWQQHRKPVEQRLSDLVRLMKGRGVSLEIVERTSGDYVFFACRSGGQESPHAFAPILRSQLAAAVAEVFVGPLTDRWLAHRLTVEAYSRRYPLTPAIRSRAVVMARQLVEAPPAEAGSAHGAPACTPAFASSEALGGGSSGAGAAGAGSVASTVLTTNLLRWQARLGRQLVEALAARPEGTVVESVVWFRWPSYMAALKQAAAAAVGELVAERQEQRSTSPWRGLWLGPPPRIYEVHLLRGPGGTYHLLDRWGLPAGSRWPGESPGEAGSEEAAIGHLMRLSPRRIIVHLADDAPVQAAVRAAFPGRVHTCRGCPRCIALNRRSPAPSPSR